MLHHKFDLYGWLNGTQAESGPRTTTIAPPEETVNMKANFTGNEWILLDKAQYMATHFSQNDCPDVTITSCTPDADFADDPDMDLNFQSGEVTITGGCKLTIAVKLTMFDILKTDFTAKRKVCIQAVDMAGNASGNVRYVWMNIVKGVGSFTYVSKVGESEHIIINSRALNAGVRVVDVQLNMVSDLSIVTMG